eukprot:m.90986 g.90986  ORF g.90986 m.90986 type:complete len:285 (-) comp15024_c0_seq2:75-929(-)
MFASCTNMSRAVVRSARVLDAARGLSSVGNATVARMARCAPIVRHAAATAARTQRRALSLHAFAAPAASRSAPLWTDPRLYSTESKDTKAGEGEGAAAAAAADTDAADTEAKPEDAEASEEVLVDERDELITQYRAEIEVLEDKFKRALADAENVRQRSRVEVENARQFGIQKFSKDLLGIADVLQMATDAVPEEALTDDNPHLTALFTGLQSTQKLMLKVFTDHGLEQISPLGEKFDPNLHDAGFQMPDPNLETGTVGAVVKTGYMLNGRVLRPAAVGVVKNE